LEPLDFDLSKSNGSKRQRAVSSSSPGGWTSFCQACFGPRNHALDVDSRLASDACRSFSLRRRRYRRLGASRSRGSTQAPRWAKRCLQFGRPQAENMEEENAAALICAALIFSELDLDDGFDEFDQVAPPPRFG